MTLSLLQEPVQSYEDSNGKPLNGGQLFTYSAGTLTPKATYQDADGLIANTNPVILNERGEATVYGDGNYRFILKNSVGATIWDRDNILSISAATTGAVQGIRDDLADTTDDAKGDAMVGVKNADTGLATTQHMKNLERLSLWDFIPDSQKAAIQGGTSVYDATTAVQAAVEKAKNSQRKTIEVPGGLYNVQHVDCIGSAYSGIRFVAVGGKPTFKWKKPAAGRQTIAGFPSPTFSRYNAADGMFLFDSNTTDTTDDTDAIKDIYFFGIRFQADVAADGFDELMHLVCGYGVSRMTFELCEFVGFLGDGLSIVRGLVDGGNAHAYNSDVTVRNCYFDGINKDNRNGISFYYCDGFHVVDCDIRNTTRSNMPGGIDVEPDSATVLTRVGKIERTRFRNIGGTAGAISIQVRHDSPFPHCGFDIGSCHFQDVVTPLFAVTLGATDSDPDEPANIWLHDCTALNMVVPFDIRVRGVTIERNLFKTVTTTTRSSGNNCQDVIVRKNTFDGVSYDGGLFFAAATVNVAVDDNTFVNMANKAILFTSNGCNSIQRNRYVSTLTASAKAHEIPVSTPEAYIGLKIADNVSSGTFASPLTKLAFLTDGTEVDTYNEIVPNQVPYETVNFWSNGLYPNSGYGGNKAGLVVMMRDARATLVGNTTQLFYPADDVANFFYRRATGSTTWSQWKAFDGTPVT